MLRLHNVAADSARFRVCRSAYRSGASICVLRRARVPGKLGLCEPRTLAPSFARATPAYRIEIFLTSLSMALSVAATKSLFVIVHPHIRRRRAI